MFVPSDHRSSYLHGMAAYTQQDRRKRYLTGLLARGVLGSFDPRTRYLSGPRRRGLFGLGQDSSDGFTSIDPFSTDPLGLNPSNDVLQSSINPAININPNEGIIYTNAGPFNVPYTLPGSPSLNQPVSAIPGSTAAANAQVIADLPPGESINSQGNLIVTATGQVLNPNVQLAQAAAAGAQSGAAIAQYVNSNGQVTAVPAGYSVNSAGQLVPLTGTASITSWLNSSSLVSGYLNSSVLIFGVVGFAAISMLGNKKKRR
jgi:hypothetical protein